MLSGEARGEKQDEGEVAAPTGVAAGCQPLLGPLRIVSHWVSATLSPLVTPTQALEMAAPQLESVFWRGMGEMGAQASQREPGRAQRWHGRPWHRSAQGTLSQGFAGHTACTALPAIS